MEKPKVAGIVPKVVEIEKGKNYAWCACGRSENQPWCNGQHRESGYSPKIFKAEETKSVALCMCKQTSTPPFCDGTHKKL